MIPANAPRLEKNQFKLLARALFAYVKPFKLRFLQAAASMLFLATIRGGIKSIARQGACPEAQWPYDLAQLLVQPPQACFQAALAHRAVSYKRIHRDLDLFRACLAEGWPFVFGFSVYASFHAPEVGLDGAVPMPQHGESHHGGHAVLAVGYDDAARTFLFLNSFGAGWGQGGFGTMPYDYLAHPHLSEDFWTLRAVAG